MAGKTGLWPEKTGFGQFWPAKVVFVGFDRENWLLAEKNWFWPILTEKTGFGPVWPKKLGFARKTGGGKF